MLLIDDVLTTGATAGDITRQIVESTSFRLIETIAEAWASRARALKKAATSACSPGAAPVTRPGSRSTPSSPITASSPASPGRDRRFGAKCGQIRPHLHQTGDHSRLAGRV